MSEEVLAGVVMAAGAAGTLAAERSQTRFLALAAKSLASMAFVALAWWRLGEPDAYGSWVLVALVFCLCGDVLLALPRGLMVGLVSFLVGHLAYVLAFHSLQPVRDWPLPMAAPVVAASVLALRLLWPHLKTMRSSVVVYALAISVMAWGALSVALAGAGPPVVAAGALLFWASDLAVARDRFVKPGLVNRVWGLPAYYTGQFLLALSVGM